MSNLLQYLEKYSRTVQQLASRGWHWGRKSYWLEEGKEVGGGRAEGSSAIGDGGQAATSRELTYVIGHVTSCSHLWKFATWRFIHRGLPVMTVGTEDESVRKEIGDSGVDKSWWLITSVGKERRVYVYWMPITCWALCPAVWWRSWTYK